MINHHIIELKQKYNMCGNYYGLKILTSVVNNKKFLSFVLYFLTYCFCCDKIDFW